MEDETVAARLVIVKKQGNACGAKRPYCTGCLGQHGRQRCNDKKHLLVCRT
jgi:hypothetical protein